MHAESNSEKRRPSGTLKLLCVGMVVAILVATLWPFNPSPKNAVYWLKDQNGVHFGGKGIVRSSSPFQLIDSSKQNISSTLQVIVWPADADQVHTFLSFYSGKTKPQLELRQYLDGVLLFVTVGDARGALRRIELDADRVLRKEQPTFLAFTSGPHGTTVYMNGKIVEHISWYQMPVEDFQGDLILGTSPIDHDPWTGKLLGAGFFSKEFSAAEIQRSFDFWQSTGRIQNGPGTEAIATYSFVERDGVNIKEDAGAAPSLNIPVAYSIPYKPALKPFWREYSPGREYVNDVIRNVAGFIPLGFLLAGYFSKTAGWPKALLFVLLCGSALSFTIEVLQASIPERNSGTTDIITNTTGAILGAIAWRVATKLFKKPAQA